MSWLHLQTEQVPALHHTVSPWKLQGSEKLDCNDSPNVYEDNAFIYSSPEYTPWAWFSTCSHCPPVPVPQCLPTTNTTIVGFRSGLKRIYRIKKKKNPFQAKTEKNQSVSLKVFRSLLLGRIAANKTGSSVSTWVGCLKLQDDSCGNNAKALGCCKTN